MSALDIAELDAWFDRRVADRLFSGSLLVIVDGEVAYSYAGGIAHRGHGVPVTGDTRFRVASIAKTVVAVTVLRLVENGDVSLDAPIADVLPEEWQTPAVGDRVTMHHLLSHTAGIANYHDDDNTWASFTACWDRIPPQRVRRPSDLLPLFADRPRRAEPGETYEYADVNYIVVGMAIEAVTGRSFADVAGELVLAPLDMDDSDFAANDTDPDRMATGYLATDEPWESWTSNVFSVPAAGLPDGGLITTPADLATLYRSIVQATLLQPSTAAAMMRPQVPATDDLEQYGYGLELVVEDDEVTIVGHGGHDPGVSALASHWPGYDTTIVVLCNHDRGSWAATQRLAVALGLPDPRE